MLYDDAIALEAELRDIVKAEYEARALMAQVSALGAVARTLGAS